MVAKTCLENDICKSHQTAFYSVAAFYCVVCLTMVGYMVANDRRAQAAEMELTVGLSASKLTAAQQHQEMMERTLGHIDSMKMEVLQRISRVEAKIEK